MKRFSVKSLLTNGLIVLILAGVYIALTEQLTLENALIGLGISVIALWLTNKVFLMSRYAQAFTLNGWYIVYIGYLLLIILKSAAVSLAFIFTKNISINLIPYQTQLKDQNLKSMLANAITLTPGTVTADIKGDTLEVMKLCKLCNLDQTSGFARIEKILKRMERSDAA